MSDEAITKIIEDAASRTADVAANKAAEAAVGKALEKMKEIANDAAQSATRNLETRIQLQLDAMNRRIEAGAGGGGGGAGSSYGGSTVGGGIGGPYAVACRGAVRAPRIEFIGWVKDWSDIDATGLVVDEAKALLNEATATMSAEQLALINSQATADQFERWGPFFAKVYLVPNDTASREDMKALVTKLQTEWATKTMKGQYVRIKLETSDFCKPLVKQAGKFYGMCELQGVAKGCIKMQYYHREGKLVARCVPVNNVRPFKLAMYENSKWKVVPEGWANCGGRGSLELAEQVLSQ